MNSPPDETEDKDDDISQNLFESHVSKDDVIDNELTDDSSQELNPSVNINDIQTQNFNSPATLSNEVNKFNISLHNSLDQAYKICYFIDIR